MSKTGTIEKIHSRQDGSKYGFIKVDGESENAFFSMTDAMQDWTEGRPVAFELTTGANGKPKAISVRLAGSSSAGRGGPSSRPGYQGPGYGGGQLPLECVFSTFYGPDGYLDEKIFFVAAKKAAGAFDDGGVTPTSYRRIYQQFLNLIKPLRGDESRFPKTREEFGRLYAHRIEYGVSKNVLKPILRELFDRHKDLALSSSREMLGFFEYVTCILCYTKK